MKAIKLGCKVKICDIGPLGICVHTGRQCIEVELEGERFWILKRLCEVIEQ